ncbi:hypothetical protein ACOJIV_22720 [Haloarcula sp. AONF1]
MSDLDENLLTAAKLSEQLVGEAEGKFSAHPFSGSLPPGEDLGTLGFLEGVAGDADLEGTALLDETLKTLQSRAVSEALRDPSPMVMAHYAGINNSSLDGSKMLAHAAVTERIAGDESLTTVTAFGVPNSGKTNTTLLLVQLAAAAYDDLFFVSNVPNSGADAVVYSMYDLMTVLLENRDRPKVVLIDEGSTHFDARTNRREVSAQWSPAVKRFSKIGVKMCAVVGHTGKDIHPEHKRLTNLALYKPAADVAEFYASWDADDDGPSDLLFGGPVDNIEKTTWKYDPDDASPWAWDLPEGVFNTAFEGWDEFADMLADMGRAE